MLFSLDCEIHKLLQCVNKYPTIQYFPKKRRLCLVRLPFWAPITIGGSGLIMIFSLFIFVIRPHLASPPFLLSKREKAVLQIFNNLHNNHINIISLLIIFGVTNCYQYLRKAGLCVVPLLRRG